MKKIIVIFIILLFYLPQFSPAKDKNNLGTTPPFDSTRLTSYTTSELINYLTLKSINWYFKNRGEVIEFVIEKELIRRKDISKMINAFKNPKDSFQKEEMVNVLYQFDDPIISETFKKFINSNELSKTMYYCLNYLAKKGDMAALKILNKNYFGYPVSSLQWSYTVKLFGKYQYKPATDNLIWSLNAASLNLVDAAFKSLYMLYPDAPHDYDSLEDAQKGFKEYIIQLKEKTVNK